MKNVILTKVLHRLELIKFLRTCLCKDIYHDYIYKTVPSGASLSLQEACNFADKLPFQFSISWKDEDEVMKKLSNIAEFEIRDDPEEFTEYNFCNMNIDPPEEVKKALIWLESLADEEKIHVRNLAGWFNRAAVC